MSSVGSELRPSWLTPAFCRARGRHRPLWSGYLRRRRRILPACRPLSALGPLPVEASLISLPFNWSFTWPPKWPPKWPPPVLISGWSPEAKFEAGLVSPLLPAPPALLPFPASLSPLPLVLLPPGISPLAALNAEPGSSTYLDKMGAKDQTGIQFLFFK